MRGSLKFAAPILALLLLVPLSTIYRQNIEVWAAQNGLSGILAGSRMPSSLQGLVLVAAFVFLLGAAAGLWAEFWMRRRFPARFSRKMKLVEGKSFRHERVRIDGKRFSGCHFNGVTLVFEGNGLFGFEHCSFEGSFSVDLAHPAADGAMGLVRLAKNLGLPFILEDAVPQRTGDRNDEGK